MASEAAMRAPEEVYKGQQQGAPKAAEELSREDRTRLRAKKKRAGKKQKVQQVSALKYSHRLLFVVCVSHSLMLSDFAPLWSHQQDGLQDTLWTMFDYTRFCQMQWYP